MKTDESGATVFSPRRGAELQTWSHWETPCGGIAGDAGGQGGGVFVVSAAARCGMDPRKRAEHHAAVPLLWKPSGEGGVHPSKHLLKSNILTVTLQGGLFLRSRRIAESVMTSNQNTNQRWLKQRSDWHFQRETEAQAVKLELRHTAVTSCHGCPQTINCKIFCAPWYVKNRCLCVGVLMWP